MPFGHLMAGGPVSSVPHGGTEHEDDVVVLGAGVPGQGTPHGTPDSAWHGTMHGVYPA